MELNELIKEINNARADPKAYANKLIYQMSYISKGDNKIFLPSQEVIDITEGFKAYHEGINYLNQCPSLSPVSLNVPLSLICVNEASKLSKEGLSITNPNTNSNANENRFKLYGTYDSVKEILFVTQAKESIDYESIVTQLLVCDGDNNRTQRSIILNSDFNMIGLGKWRYDNNQLLLIEIVFAKNWKTIPPNSSQEDEKENHHLEENKEQIIMREIEKYEKTLEARINFKYQYNSINKERKIFTNKENIKLINQYHFVLDGNIKKKIVFSKTFFL